MARKTSELSIDSDVHSNGKGKRIRMKWKMVPLWYVVFLSIFTLSDADGNVRWKRVGSFFNPHDNSSDEFNKMSIMPYSGTFGSYKGLMDGQISSLRGGAAVNLFPTG